MATWLRSVAAAKLGEQMKDELKDMHVIIACFGDSDPLRAAYGTDPMGDEDIPTVTEKVIGAARLAVAMGKSTDNLDWNEEIGGAAPAPKPAKDFLKSSDARFEKVSAKIRELFGAQNMEVCEEMIAAARKLRDAERAAFLASV
jgi:hypothetical protein